MFKAAFTYGKGIEVFMGRLRYTEIDTNIEYVWPCSEREARQIDVLTSASNVTINMVDSGGTITFAAGSPVTLVSVKGKSSFADPNDIIAEAKKI
ncbi:hypothetical protein [Pseudomonas gingeri]|uniref:hypothetical protein n=1 Tax=Pseudomonas gingeri TaxID=117681 RepID=UPI00159FCD87|nr:hypothetical protein [Pseudomonas gingeri]NWE48987.1 hypothetical protein [Pseudomonas gingeri]